ncbi:MAG: penicillin acylase family protein, partial [Gammaproteobacteria bacterium]|nr:penicillin acylase family protein [Gammaproteobacteria bacterium]
MKKQIAGADAPFEVCWDSLGIPHIYAATVADAYRGMGYVEGHERLWQIHLSCLYANGNAASAMGERFVRQDALHRAFGVPANYPIPDSPGDWVVDAYLEGLNALVDSLDEIPPEFAHTGVEPRRFTRADVAARYRFTNWFQHRSWPNKMVMGQLMARHGVEYFRHHVLRFSSVDETLIEELREPLQSMNLAAVQLLYPDAPVSGSNNWAVTSRLSNSGKPMLAMDPHQAFSIPNTFFYSHLHAPGWDVFGASFPGVPYFMMGYTRDLAWGLTTGNVDNYDVYVEEVDGDTYRDPDGWQPLQHRVEKIEIKGGSSRDIEIVDTRHGPLIEALTHAVGLTDQAPGRYQTSISWNLTHLPTSAGALAKLPLARDAAEFGEALFEGDVCPLVNNIICVDRHDDLRRFIAATLPVRNGATGIVPLAGWNRDYDFEMSCARDLLVEHNPASGYALTANNDTMGESGPFPIHNFPAHPARSNRIRELLEAGGPFSPADFEAMQLDEFDARAREVVPELLEALRDRDDEDLVLACELLDAWDFVATKESRAACLYYPFLDRVWHRR